MRGVLKAMWKLGKAFQAGDAGDQHHWDPSRWAQQGSAKLGAVLILSVGALFVGKNIIERGDKMMKKTRMELARSQAHAKAQQMIALAGFMVANSIIICKQMRDGSGPDNSWGLNQSPCRVNLDRNTSAFYQQKRPAEDGEDPFSGGVGGVLPPQTAQEAGAESSGIATDDLAVGGNINDLLKTFHMTLANDAPSGYLDLKLNTSNGQFFGATDKSIKAVSGIIRFSLVDARKETQLQALIAERASQAQLNLIDKDHFYIKAAVKLVYTKPPKLTQRTVSKTTYYRRPIAITTTRITSNAICDGQCTTSRSLNPYPACRGLQEIPREADVDIKVITVNNGPGVLYDLAYERRICLASGIGKSCQPQLPGPNDDLGPPSVDLGFAATKDVLSAREYIHWTDTARCQRFVGVTRNRKSAAAQHTGPAGKVEYTLSTAAGSLSTMEPFRMNVPLQKDAQNIPGMLNLIYVAPTH